MRHLPLPLFTAIEPGLAVREILACWQRELETFDAEQILQWAFETFGHDVAFAPSWREEDIIIHSLLEKRSPRIRIVDCIHGLLLSETWASPEPHESAKNFDGRKASAALWSRFHKEHLCKMHETTISTCKAWIVSARREQAAQLEDMPILSWNARFGVFRIAPLAQWRKENVQKIVRQCNPDFPAAFPEQADNGSNRSDGVLNLYETYFSRTQQL